MRTIIILLMTTGAAWSADYHLERAAQMVVDQTFCHKNYDVQAFQKHIADSAAARGVSYDKATEDLKAVAANKWIDIQSTGGTDAHCASVR